MTTRTKRKLTKIAEAVVVEPTKVASKTLWDHLKNWKLEYVLLPLTGLVVIGTIKFATYLNNGRMPTENADDLVGFSKQLLKISTLIFGLSLVKEAVGHWWTKEQIIAKPMLAWPGTVVTVAAGAFFTYLLTH
jgi:hypothetical protein